MNKMEKAILDQVQKTKVDARYSANGHYCAAKRYSKYSHYLGGTVTHG